MLLPALVLPACGGEEVPTFVTAPADVVCPFVAGDSVAPG